MAVNIIDLIEKNPVSKLTDEYNNKFLDRIKCTFTDNEQKIFISSFYCYVKYDTNKDYIVDLGNVWKWLGFARKSNAKTVLEKNFTENKDYFISTNNIKSGSGGHNTEKIMMNINTFKSFCMVSNTTKSREIHNYYIKLENIMFNIFSEQTDCLTEKIKNFETEKENEINKINEENIKDAKRKEEKAIERTTLLQFPLNTECVYMGVFSHDDKTYIKYGQTNNLNQRVRDHRKTFGDFILSGAFRVQNKVEIENLITHDSRVKPHLTSLVVGDKTYKEIIVSGEENMLVENFHCIIVNIIETRKFNIENFHRVVKENDTLNAENQKLREEIRKHLTEIEDFKREQHNLITKVKITKEEKHEVEDRIVKMRECISPNEEIVTQVESNDEDKKDIDKWIYNHCVIGSGKEVNGKVIVGWHRITTQNKHREETKRFTSYLDARFGGSTRLKNGNGNGYLGITLKEINHNQFNLENKNDTEKQINEFLENECVFSPDAKILMSDLVNKFEETSNSRVDKRVLKHFIKCRKDVFFYSIHTNGINGVGFYGFNLKGCVAEQSTTSSTAKAVEKVCHKTGKVLGEWKCVREAGESSPVSQAGMSRAIKTKKLFEEGDMVVFYRAKV
tara:strand:- start:85 stop:1941 length:1857 start_codon:yes stop_codon:yes gene_type:complete